MESLKKELEELFSILTNEEVEEIIEKIERRLIEYVNN